MGTEDLLLYGVSGLVSGLLLAALHWAPIGERAGIRDRRICYALGAAVVIGVPVVCLLLTEQMGMTRGQSYWAAYLVVNTLISGLALQFCYMIDDGQPVTTDDVRKHDNPLQ